MKPIWTTAPFIVLLVGVAGLGAVLPADDEFQMSVVTDDYSAPGPAAKTGTLVRGWGRREDGSGTVLRLDADRRVPASVTAK